MAENKWTQPTAPPPPMFTGKKERDLVKQVNDELIERVIGQQVVYYPISLEHTNFHPLYGEAKNKTFLDPIAVYALVTWEGHETKSTSPSTAQKMHRLLLRLLLNRGSQSQCLSCLRHSR